MEPRSFDRGDASFWLRNFNMQSLQWSRGLLTAETHSEILRLETRD